MTCEAHASCRHKKPTLVDESDMLPPNELRSEKKKLVVTDYGLAHWIAQTYNMDINHMPNNCPSHMTSAQFDDLKLLIKDYFTARDKQPSKPEVAMN